MKKEKFNLNQKVFMTLSNSDNGEVIKGHLVGKQLESGEFDFVYHHIYRDGQIKMGKCISSAILLDDGRLKLFEKWQWLSDDMSNGESELVEIRA